MKHSEIVESISRDTGCSKKDTSAIINSLIDLIIFNLKNGETFRIKDLGTFYIRDLKETTLVNCKTHAKYKVPSRKRIKFRIAENLEKVSKELSKK